jgi:superfamily II DNA or RNA helicase
MLRDYQQTLYTQAREQLAKNKSIFIQLATGGGKTAIFSSMCESVFQKDKRAWIIVPRKELLMQGSNHLGKWKVPHGIISAGNDESRAFKIHVVSKDTLIRRYDKIKNWPDLLIFDEAHLYLDRQKEIVSHLPDHSKVIGFSATPERLDGRGLSELYESLIEGPSIPWLTERGFLTNLRYYAPPLQGIENIHKRGTELDEEELEELLKRRKVYGELVGHYEKYGKGKAALIFCRSVKSAYHTAERFQEKGFNFHCLEGKMPAKKRRDLIQAHKMGEIDGLTNCDLATYGLDIPRIEYGASIRPTLSRALYFQMIGRILRPFEDPITGYKKEEALFFDHVNLVLEHQEDKFPGVPPHYVHHIEWNFTGTEKRKRKKKDANMRLCPFLDYMYCEKCIVYS